MFYIGADTVSNLQNLDYFGIEGGTVDQIELGAFSGLTVEKLASDPHQVRASVLLNILFDSNEICHTTDAP